MKRVNHLPGPVYMVTALVIGLFTLLVIAHDDDQFEQDRIPPYDGPGVQERSGRGSSDRVSRQRGDASQLDFIDGIRPGDISGG